MSIVCEFTNHIAHEYNKTWASLVINEMGHMLMNGIHDWETLFMCPHTSKASDTPARRHSLWHGQ